MSRPRVAVVGGGLAGMAAAVSLADAGVETVLVERRPVLGGLTSSVVRRGLTFDNGQHVFLRCCTAYMGFLERIGAAGKVQVQDRLEVPVLAPGGRCSTLRRSSLPAPLHLAAALARYRHLPLGDRARLPRAALALRRLRLDDPELDKLTFAEWLAGKGQSARAVDVLWGLITLPTVNLPAGEASLAMAAMVFKTGLLERADAGDIGWSRVPLAELHGGHGSTALADAGVEVMLGQAVESVRTGRRGGFEVAIGSAVMEVDAAVLATPPRAAATLSGLPEARAAVELGTSPIVNVHLVLDRRVTDLPMAACVDSPVQFVFDRTAASGVSQGQCLSVSLSAADDHLRVPTPELVRTYAAALGDIFPAARHAEVVDAVVTRERAATFRAVPGSGLLRPGAITGTPGLFLAGAWCDTGWPATMEGAVRSGEAAGLAAASHLGAARRAGRPAAASTVPVRPAQHFEEVPA